MSRQMKFLQISTRIRERVDLRRIPHEALDRLLAEDGIDFREWLLNLEDLASGRLKIDREGGRFSIDGRCYP